MTEGLPSWNDTPTKAAIVDFVEHVISGPDAVPGAERIAVFDNDGTLWTEKPMPVALVFILQRRTKMAGDETDVKGLLAGFGGGPSPSDDRRSP